jgi:tetratricopeptide (TPR) repeat protein
LNLAPSKTSATDARVATPGWHVRAVVAVLILAAVGAYWNSFNVPFLLDDSLAISGNSSIRHLEQIGNVLSPPTATTTAARPLLNLSFALNYAGGGMSVRGYHALNLLVHICAGLALLGIMRRSLLLPGLRPRYGEAALPLAAFAALLWTLHPLQTESVTYISQRAESLMGLFYLLTLYCFIRSVPSITGSDLTKGNEGNEVLGAVHGPWFSSLPSAKISGLEAVNSSVTGTGWLYLSVTACLCGMATKQVMVTAPVLVLLYDRAFVSGSFRSALANRRWYYVSLAATWLLLGLLMLHSPLPKRVGFQAGVNWSTYALTELRVVTEYLGLAFWPHPLVFDYGSEILATDPLAAAPYALIIVAVLGGVALAWRRSPMAGFLGCWFFLILAPTSTVVPIAEQPMAESRVYLALAAVVVLVTLWSYTLGHRRAYILLGLLAVGLGALTVHRNHDYRSELSIWEDTLARLPNTSRGYLNLGMAFAKMPGHLLDAITHYEDALRLNPNYAEAHNNLANVLIKIPGRMPEAIRHYEEALRIDPTDAEAHSNLAIELAKMPGRLPAAMAHFEEALRLKPDFAEAHSNFALELAKMPGRLPDAIAHYETALRLKPDLAEAHNNLANALEEMPGRLPDAIAQYEAAIRLAPDLAVAHNNLANALVDMPGRLADAITHYEQALRLQPGYAEAHYNLASALAGMPDRMADATAHYEEAVRLKPDLIDARNNLAVIYAKTGRIEAAISQLEIAARLNPDSTAIRDTLEKLKTRRKQ